MKSCVTTCVVLILLFLSCGLRPSLHAQTMPVTFKGRGCLPSSAIDAKGVQHRDSDYPKAPPWMSVDMVDSGPKIGFPIQDTFRRHQGCGLYRLTLDLRTGVVTNVSIVKSTQFAGLDNSAVFSLRKCLRKPGKWQEIEIPVHFVLRDWNTLSSPWSPKK
jgi:TonB family protein